MLRAYINSAVDSQRYWVCCSGSFEELASKVLQTEHVSESSFDDHVAIAFEASLNDVEFISNAPLWR